MNYANNTGVIQYNMTNDYMFRYILQKNEKVLRGLISALLHLKPEEIVSVEIQTQLICLKTSPEKTLYLI